MKPLPLDLGAFVTFSCQVDWLVSLFKDNMPRSYNDVIPYTGISFWRSHLYLTFGARDWQGNRVPFDHDIAMQERALSHVGLNIYDGGVWGVALALSGLGDLVDVYHRNVRNTEASFSRASTLFIMPPIHLSPALGLMIRSS